MALKITYIIIAVLVWVVGMIVDSSAMALGGV
jgi:hypothetical protein